MRTLLVFSCAMALVAAVSPAIGAEGSNTKVGPVAESAELAKPITVGDSIPDVVVQNAEGEDVNLRKLTDGHKTAIIFYRGGWCPFCNKHLKEVASVQDEIAQAGYQVIGINADRPEDVAMAQEKKGYPFTILSDSDLTAARAFGVAFKLDDATIKKYNGYGIKLMDSKGEPRYSLPVPAFYLVNPDGKISFEFHDPDYKVRISKKDLLEAIQAN